jgi:heat shock protein HtpX
VLIGVLFAAGASGITILLVAGGLLALQFFTSDKLALRSMGAHEVSPQERRAPRHDRAPVRPGRPAQAADLHRQQRDAQRLRPGPVEEGRGGVRDDGHPRAALPAELEGVMAHELTHIANRDVMVMTLAAFFASLASMIVQFGFFFGGSDDDDNGPDLRHHPRLARRLRDLVLPHAGALALPRVRRRPRGRRDHRPPERAVLGAAEDQRHDAAHPADDLRAHAEMNAFYIVPPA